ncbi:cytidylyltransferase domain-containing protein [Kurthia sibirica]|uniref:Acylneuraminate cytidylyltransferase n=1 Tax=Kurthia sibirica TaxID=202750 RepID=A0A2U3AMR2_9BACL|nr:glycosyltransferase family protein [Kurthia sibirica]PWI25801.1 acylneuraminate cytidylyltransferase [Kurthia sibirica]GEK33619.1 3-deoxy-manno-octulosonate cytidylyltransferase [Kurthia sibirica]
MGVTAIIQARMGSTRLPGKIMKQVNGKSLLLHQIERIRKCKNIDRIIIATTIEEQDDEIVKFCEHNRIHYYRGAEHDVLARYYETWKAYGGETIVRLTSDCPIIDSEVVDDTIQYFKKNSFDYVSNTIERTFPRGMDTEVFSSSVLEKTYHEASLISEKEHVTAYIYTHANLFSIGSYKAQKDYSKYRWTVDTDEDFLVVKNLIETSARQKLPLNLLNAVKLMEHNPDWFDINAHIEQKKI